MPWGRGVGKTFLLIFVIGLLVRSFDYRKCHPRSQRKGVRIVFCMDTIAHFRAVYGLPLRDFIAHPVWSTLGGELNRSTYTIEWPGGSWFAPFPALESTSDKARGQHPDVVLADECDDIPLSVWDAVVTPMFSEPCSYDLRIIGGTPKRGRRGLLYRLHSRGMDREQWPGYYSKVWTYADAPETVSRASVEKARRELSPRVFQREYECNFDAAEGLVYDLFEESYHVRRPPKDRRPTRVVIGIDWGYADPGVLLAAEIYGHGEDAVAYITAETYQPGQVIDWWAARIAEVRDQWAERGVRVEWFADPSRPDNIEQLNSRCGVRIVGADNRIADGVDCVSDKFWIRGTLDAATGNDTRWARLYVAPECKELRRELGLYKRAKDRTNPDSYTDDIVDKDNHACDALRYLCVGAFGHVPNVRSEWGG